VSTRPVAEKEIPTGWEEINPITIRMAVPGGWIYDVMNGGVVFVPEPMPAPNAAARSWREWESLDRPAFSSDVPNA
jgi:hypothetical protein